MFAMRTIRAAWLVTVFAAGLSFAGSASAEIYVGSNKDERVVVAVQVDEAAAQAWLPAGWRLSPNSKGTLKGANLLVVFVDRLINLDEQGKPTAGGTFRTITLLMPAKHEQTGALAAFVIRIYGPHASSGPFKNSVQATVRREASAEGANLEPGEGSEVWKARAVNGGEIEFEMAYRRGMPALAKREVALRSAVDPDLAYLYRYEQLVDFVKSVPGNTHRVQDYALRVTVPELEPMFNGGEELVGIAVVPWYTRETFRP